MQDEGFPNLLEYALKFPVIVTHIFQLNSAIKSLKKPLQLLSRNKFTNIQQKTDEARAKLLQRRLHIGPLNADLLTAFLVSWHSKAKWIHECWGTIVPRFFPLFWGAGQWSNSKRWPIKFANYTMITSR